MPGNNGAWVFAESRSLAMRFSRSSSLTLRARRAGVNSLARRAPRVVGSEVAMSKYRCLAGMKGSEGQTGNADLRGMDVRAQRASPSPPDHSDWRTAAVAEELDACDEAAVVGAEEDNGFGDLVRCAESAHRDEAVDVGKALLAYVAAAK